MELRDIIGLGTAVLVLAGITVAIVNGDKTARIIGTVGNSFANVVTSATGAKAA